MPDTPSVQDQIDEKRASVDALRTAIQLAKRGDAQAVADAGGQVQLSRLEQEEARLKTELASVASGVTAEPVVPSEPVVESAVPVVAPPADETESTEDDKTESSVDSSPIPPTSRFGGSHSN